MKTRAFFSSRLLICEWFGAVDSLVGAINSAEVAGSRHVSAINVALDSKTGWCVIKYGVYPNKVGLQVFDPEAAREMQSAFNDKLNRLANGFRGDPIYVGHPDDPEWARQNPGIRAAAVGRIREMKIEDDGLHLRPAYNDEGKRLVEGEAPAYEAFSPNWGMAPTSYKGRKAFRPVELYSIGLTNQPNIPGSFIGLNEALPPEKQPSTPPMKEHLIKLLAALGFTVAADADETRLSTAVNEALPKAQAALAAQTQLATAVNEVATLKPQIVAVQAQVTTAVNEAATLRTSLATERGARAGIVITSAINEGRLTEAGRAEWLGKFTAAGADFSAIETDLKRLTKAVNTQTQAKVGDRRGAAVNQGKIRAVNEAVNAYKAAHPNTSHAAAFDAVRSEKPDLFTNDKS